MRGESAEKSKMLAGAWYREDDPLLAAERLRARSLLRRFNATTGEMAAERRRILDELLGRAGRGIEIEPPFHCDYGRQIEMEDGVYLGVNCVILDGNRVRIGAGTMIGPGVHIYTPDHPRDPETRATGVERALPVTIGANVWIGGGAILCPGVTVGAGSIVGAGSVVTRDLPEGVVAAGNPCRTVRRAAGS